MTRELYLQRTAKDLETRARLCLGPILESLDKEGGVDAVCKKLGRETDTRITVILPDGRVVGDTEADPADMDNHKVRPEIRKAASGEVGRLTRPSPTLKEELMYVAIPLERDGSYVAVVRTSIPVTEINQVVGKIRQKIVVAVIGVICLLAVISLWLSARITLPLRKMSVGAESFARGELEHRLPRASFEEINILAEAMDRMAEQLDERIETVQCQQNELEAVLGSMEEGVLAIDNDAVIINVNQTCAALLGMDPGELKGRSVHEVVRKPDLLEFVESSLSNESPVEDDILMRGEEDRWLNLHGTALYDAANRKMGTLIVLRDVTRLRRLENVRRDFVANVSHELKTPITSIKGFVETLIDGAFDNRQDASRFLEIIARQVNRLDTIIEDLLTLSRLEKGAEEQGNGFVTESVRDVLQASIQMCEKKAADKNINVRLECAVDLTAPMNGHLLEQAVVNLVDNAVKYSEPGSEVHVSAAKDADDLVIRVQDWGCGIERKHLPRLFERFYRVDKARSRELGGTGLGLAIVRHIALVHRGSVSVESEVGKGTTVSFIMPVNTMLTPR
ncbi:MAG: PAS domain-containing protein [Pirellulales bacterium]|nr:PAS domain-containing protein [Pirellulales bacterium]